jgi:negative regulator of flagellin synthesis FlgM
MLMKIDDKIIPYEINKQLPQASPNGTEKPNEKNVSEEKKAEGTQGAEQDSVVNISEASQKAQSIKEIIASEPDIREDKVSALKEKIESGNYTIDYDRVADKLVDAFLDELF